MQLITLWINVLSLLEYLHMPGIPNTENSEAGKYVSFHIVITLE